MEKVAIHDIEWIPVEEINAPGRVRGAAMSVARRLGFSEHRIGEVAIAATELASNLYHHAKEGMILVRVRREHNEAAVELIAIDAGPGIENFSFSLRDGESSRGTLGIGLGAILRLASDFDSHSVPGLGTVMIATFWHATSLSSPALVAGMTRPMGKESVCGDAWTQQRSDSEMFLMLVDGLGHGELAATAARTAVQAFEQIPNPDLITALKHLDTALRPTRGAAVAMVHVNFVEAKLSFAGVGNIAVWVDNGQARQSLLSSPGIIGNNAKVTRAITLDLPKNATIILHSDGLSSKWDLNTYAGLRIRNPNLIAATLLRDAGIRHDDASVVVAKTT